MLVRESNPDSFGEPSKCLNNRGTKRSPDSYEVSKQKRKNEKKSYIYGFNQAERLWGLQNTGRLCDVTILVGPNQEKVVCHKNVLLVSSPYFEKMFAFQDDLYKNMFVNQEEAVLRNSAGAITITVDKEGLAEIDKEVVNAVLRFIYVGVLPDSIDAIIPPIFVLADIWFLDEVKEICVGKMIKDISASNFQQLLRFSGQYEILNLSEAVLDFIARYLPHIYQHEEFLKLNINDLKNVLNLPLAYEHEDFTVVKALKFWTISCGEKLHLVLEMVRLDFLTKVQLQNLSNSSLIKEEEIFNEKVITAMETDKIPHFAQYFPLSKEIRPIDIIECNRTKNWGTIIDFRSKPIASNQIKMNCNIIIDFIRPYINPGVEGGDVVNIHIHSEVCYKNTIYALFAPIRTYHESNDQTNTSIPIFTYSLLHGTSKPLDLDISENYSNILKKVLYLQDNYLFYCICISGTKERYRNERRFIIFMKDLDNENSKWVMLVNWRMSLRYRFSSPRVIRVDQDGVIVHVQYETRMGAHLMENDTILKLPRMDDISLEDNQDDSREITTFPAEARSIPVQPWQQKLKNDLFYDFEGQNLFVFRTNNFVYNFQTNQWTNLPPFSEIAKVQSVHIDVNKLHVVGSKIEDGGMLVEVLDLKTRLWQMLDVCDNMRGVQLRGFPVSRLLLCKDETESENEHVENESDDE